MRMTIEEKDLNNILKTEFKRIFGNTVFSKLSDFQRRQCVFNYLVNNSEYDFTLLNKVYSGEIREYANEIIDVLSPENSKKGICNSFSYTYKILLDKLNIPCMLVICDVQEESIENLKENGVTTNTSIIKKDEFGKYLIPHMLVLVQNNDKSFSFDDITYAIFSKGTEKEKEYFNYDYQKALEYGQVNLEGFDTDMLRYIVNNSQDTQNDKMIRQKYAKINDAGFLRIPKENIKKYDKTTKELEGEDR